MVWFIQIWSIQNTNQYNAMQRIFIMFNKLSLIAKMFFFFRMYFNSNDHVMTDLLWCHWLRSPWLPCTEWTVNWCCGPPPLRYPSGVAGTSLWIWREPHHWSPLGRPCWPYNHWQWPLEEGLAMKKIKFYLQYPTSFDTTKFSCSFSYFFKNMFEIKVKS